MFWDNLFKKNKAQESHNTPAGNTENVSEEANEKVLQDNLSGNSADHNINFINNTLNDENGEINQNSPQTNGISNPEIPDSEVPEEIMGTQEILSEDYIGEAPDNAEQGVTEDFTDSVEPEVMQSTEPLSEPETLSDEEILHDAGIPREPEIEPQATLSYEPLEPQEETREEDTTENIYHDNVDESVYETADSPQDNNIDTQSTFGDELLNEPDDDITAYEKLDFSDFGDFVSADEQDIPGFDDPGSLDNIPGTQEAFDEFNNLFDKLVTDNPSDDLFDRLNTSDDLDSLDKMIQEAMEADRRFAESGQFDDQLQEFVSDIAVYDTEEREEVMGVLQENADEYSSEDIERRKKKERTMRLFALGTAVMIIILLVAAFFLSKQLESINQPVVKQTNTAGFIFVSREAMLNDQKLVLKKLLLDNVSTVFYFSKDIGIDSKVITLTDDKNNNYALDLSYMLLKFEDPELNEPTVLRFDPLEDDITEFTLKIEDIASDEAVEFRFGAEEDLQKNISRHLSHPLKVLDDTEGLTVDITSADFSTSGSKIGFTMNWGDASPSLYLGKSAYKDPIVLQDRRGLVTKALPEPLQVQFDNMIVGRVDFGPVKSVEEKVDLHFDNLYKRFELNELFPTAPIVNNIEGNERVTELGSYKFVLERLIRQEGNYILVMHSEENTGDTGLPGKRVETIVEAQLAVVSPEGTVSFLDGTVHSGAQGTDVVFDTTEADDIFKKAPINSLMLKLDAVLIKMPTVSTTIDLAKLKTTKERNSNLALLENIFMQRHEYKAGKIPYVKITGFTDELLNDPLLKSHYMPINKVNNADYSVQILTHTVKDGLLYGLMGETFKGDTMKTQMSLLHKIIAKPQGNGFMVLYDEIIG